MINDYRIRTFLKSYNGNVDGEKPYNALQDVRPVRPACWI